MIKIAKGAARAISLGMFMTAALFEPRHGKTVAGLVIIGGLMCLFCAYHDMVLNQREENENRYRLRKQLRY